MPSTKDILGVVMGGGRGSRLHPLTKMRAKPAVPIAGKYRLIDIPLSNCINAGINKIAVLTQFKSVSLHRHISRTYVFDSFTRGWTQIYAAEQRDQSFDWYQGTADAVRKQLFEIERSDTEYTLILAGDHLYRMDYDKLAAFHWEKGADITVAVQPVEKENGPRFGLIKVDRRGRITAFAEKPKDEKTLNAFVTRDDEKKPYLGSMGIYLFKTKLLVDILRNTTDTDFGGEVIPKAIDNYTVYGYDFEGYWVDIGTIRSFYETNLRLAQPDAPFNFYDQDDRIYTRPRFLPGSTIENASLEHVLLADGGHIANADINNSVIGLRSQVRKGAKISTTVLMGADYYDTPERIKAAGGIPMGVGQNSVIEGAILDKNVRIGEGVVIKPFAPGTEVETEQWVVRDGIVVVPKSAVVPPNTYIGPD